MKTTVKQMQSSKWYLLDASDKVLGSVASDAAALLIGKNRADFAPNRCYGDKVVVINAGSVAVTGRKMKSKSYYHHTGYPGGIKEERLEDLMKEKPEEVIRKAVLGMLPKNKLRKKRIANLYVYSGAEHPHKITEDKE